MTRRLVEWDTIELRIDGERIDALVQPYVVEPIERLRLRFLNGLLRVEGSIRKFFSVPFTAEVREIRAEKTTIRVPLGDVRAAGIRIPKFLFGIFQDKLPRDLVRYEEPATLVLSLDRFLPTFIDADVQRIWIIEGGLAVTLGKGGADLPPTTTGGPHDGNADHA